MLAKLKPSLGRARFLAAVKEDSCNSGTLPYVCASSRNIIEVQSHYPKCGEEQLRLPAALPECRQAMGNLHFVPLWLKHGTGQQSRSITDCLNCHCVGTAGFQAPSARRGLLGLLGVYSGDPEGCPLQFQMCITTGTFSFLQFPRKVRASGTHMQ